MDLLSIIYDVNTFRLFKPVWTALLSQGSMQFLHLNFDLTFSNILNHKEVSSHVPEYLQIQTVPIVSYYYTNTLAPTIFNYKKLLQDFKNKM